MNKINKKITYKIKSKIKDQITLSMKNPSQNFQIIIKIKLKNNSNNHHLQAQVVVVVQKKNGNQINQMLKDQKQLQNVQNRLQAHPHLVQVHLKIKRKRKNLY